MGIRETKDSKLYDNLLQYYKREEIEAILRTIAMKAELYLNRNGDSGCYIHYPVYNQMILDILQDMQGADKYKLSIYIASWWLRRRPIQIKNTERWKDIYINEKFVFYMLLEAEGLFEDKVEVENWKQREAADFLEQFFYYLKYKDTNPLALSQMLDELQLFLNIAGE